MHLPDAVAELGTLLGLGPIKFNEYGLCRLQFDGGLTVDLESADGGETLHICSSLGALPDSAEVCETLLHANFLGEGTGGAVFAWDQGRDELLLHRTMAAAQLDATGLASAVETFVNFYDGWTRKLDELAGAAETPSTASSSELPSSLRV
jgi:hypothetical protein